MNPASTIAFLLKRLFPSLLLPLIFLSCLQAQVNQWTWINGDNLPGKNGVYGTQGTPDAANKPGGRSGAIKWKDSSGDLWLMGGFGLSSSGTGNLNDLWKYSITSNQWTWISGDNTSNQAGVYGTKGIADPANKPGARNTGTSASDADGNLWLLGGYSSSGYMNDLWKFNPSTGEWTWIGGDNTANKKGVYGTMGIPDAANKPGARYSAASCTDINGDIWIFGGYGYGASGSDSYLNDLWKFNPSTGEWTWISGDNTSGQVGVYGTKGTASTGNKPGGRYSTAMWTDISGNIWLFGGTGFALTTAAVGGELNDLWKFNPSTGEWTWVSGDDAVNVSGNYGTKGITASTNKPGGRHGTAAWKDIGGRVYIFGGNGYPASAVLGNLSDLWELDLYSGKWTWIGGSSAGSQMGVYGTKGTAAATNIPGARYDAVGWIDDDRRLWLFGGNGIGSTTATGYLDDMWSYMLPAVTLPVELVSFSAQQSGEAVQLDWSTAQEINSDHFGIERSSNGLVFETIGNLPASGNSVSPVNYRFTDPAPLAGINYYRIKQFDIDGKFTYSKVASVVIGKDEFNLYVLQNPVQSSLQLKLELPVPQRLTFLVKNSSGNLIMHKEQSFDKGTSLFSLPVDNLAKGVYYLTVKGERSSEVKTVIKL